LESPLADKYRFIAFDLPGHGLSGRSDKPATDYSLRSSAEILIDFAEKLDASKGFFAGWSLGGHIILEALDRLPSARGFIIFGTPPLGHPPAISEAFSTVPASALMYKPDQSQEDRETVLGALFRPGLSSFPESFREDLVCSDGRVRETLAAVIQEGSYEDEVKIVAEMSQPLAVFHGKEEQLVQRSYLERLDYANLWRDSVQEIPDSGHTVQWENAGQFNKLLEAFIQDYR
jgi:pimeloyl-ACP methyl ester carboxylesterase